MIDAYYNGIFSDIKDVRIPLSDRSVYFGDAVYDAMIGQNGKIYLFDEHLDRLYRSAKAIEINFKLPRESLKALISELISRSSIKDYFVYVQVSRSSNTRTHFCDNSQEANLLITVKEHKISSSDKKLSLTVMPDVRYKLCNIKTVNLLPAVLASNHAVTHGFDEVVFVRENIVTECAHSNISIIKDGVFITHPDSCFILPGITKNRLIHLAKRLEIPVVERPFTEEELFCADSVIVSSTSKLALEADLINKAPVKSSVCTTSNLLIKALFEDYWKSMEE